ncbi:MAG: hypothetical protein ACYDH5_05215 [Acidimicrobiales bacterium]
MTVMRSCRLPDELFYDVERDLWAEVSSDATLRMGLTDVGQTAGGKLQAVSFPRLASHLASPVPAGRSLAMMESAKWVGVIRAPLAGTLQEVNADLVDHPLLVNLDPYGRGWVVKFAPELSPEGGAPELSPGGGVVPAALASAGWMTGAAAMDAYRRRLAGTFRSVAGVNDDFWCVHCNDWDKL